MHPTYRGLAFLLSLGSLPIACSKDGDDDDSTGNTTKPATDPTTTGGTGTDATDPTATATAPTTSGPDGTTTTGMSDTVGTEPQMTTFLTSNTDGTTTFPDETESLPPPSDPTCLAYAGHIAECFPRYAQYQEMLAQQCELYKNYALREDGQACQDAFEAFYVCISTVACDMLEGPACADEDMQITEKCPSLGEPSTTSDTSGESGGGSGSTG